MCAIANFSTIQYVFMKLYVIYIHFDIHSFLHADKRVDFGNILIVPLVECFKMSSNPNSIILEIFYSVGYRTIFLFVLVFSEKKRSKAEQHIPRGGCRPPCSPGGFLATRAAKQVVLVKNVK